MAKERKAHTGACEQNTPVMRAIALQSSSGNCSPAPDFGALKVCLSTGLLLRSLFLSQTGIKGHWPRNGQAKTGSTKRGRTGDDKGTKMRRFA